MLTTARGPRGSLNHSDTKSSLRFCWAGSVCRPGHIGSPGAISPGTCVGAPFNMALRSLVLGIENENVLGRASTGDIPSVDRCRDTPSPCRRRRLGRWAHRWTCGRNDFWGRSHRPTLLSAATRLCGSRGILLLDARRAGMGWLSRRVDLSQHQSLRVGFSLAENLPPVVVAHFVGDAGAR